MLPAASPALTLPPPRTSLLGWPVVMWLKALKASARNLMATLSHTEKVFETDTSEVQMDGPKYVLAPALPILSRPGNEKIPPCRGCAVKNVRWCLFASK